MEIITCLSQNGVLKEFVRHVVLSIMILI